MTSRSAARSGESEGSKNTRGRFGRVILRNVLLASGCSLGEMWPVSAVKYASCVGVEAGDGRGGGVSWRKGSLVLAGFSSDMLSGFGLLKPFGHRWAPCRGCNKLDAINERVP